MHQQYKPYRSNLLSPPELRDLYRLRPAIAVRDILIEWALILASFLLVARFTEWWMVVLAIIIIGTRINGLLTIAHDGLHRRLFANQRQNDFWNDLLILGSVAAVTRLNRVNHIDHHRYVATPHDPDRYIYSHGIRPSRLRFLLFFTGLPTVLQGAKNIFLPAATRSDRVDDGQNQRYRLRDIAIIIGWQAALIGGLSYFVGWWAYPLLWVVPAYLFYYIPDTVRVFSEHSRLVEDSIADRTMRLITYEANFFERQLFAPHNMNYHAAHHLWPSIPYYNLPKADAMMRASPNCDANLPIRNSYFRYFRSYWAAMPIGRQNA